MSFSDLIKGVDVLRVSTFTPRGGSGSGFGAGSGSGAGSGTGDGDGDRGMCC